MELSVIGKPFWAQFVVYVAIRLKLKYVSRKSAPELLHWKNFNHFLINVADLVELLLFCKTAQQTFDLYNLGVERECL